MSNEDESDLFWLLAVAPHGLALNFPNNDLFRVYECLEDKRLATCDLKHIESWCGRSMIALTNIVDNPLINYQFHYSGNTLIQLLQWLHDKCALLRRIYDRPQTSVMKSYNDARDGLEALKADVPNYQPQWFTKSSAQQKHEVNGLTHEERLRQLREDELSIVDRQALALDFSW